MARNIKPTADGADALRCGNAVTGRRGGCGRPAGAARSRVAGVAARRTGAKARFNVTRRIRSAISESRMILFLPWTPNPKGTPTFVLGADVAVAWRVIVPGNSYPSDVL